MTAGAMPSVLDNFQSEEPSLEATVLELEAVNIRSSGTAHSSGADTVVCSEMLDGLDSSSSLLPSFVGKSDLTNTLLKPDSLHRPVVNSRSRQHQHVGLMEIDRRSETSSEQTKASKFKVVKLESKAPYCRGRWQCFDFHDRMKDATKSTQDRVSSSEQSSASTSTTVGGPVSTSTTSSFADVPTEATVTAVLFSTAPVIVPSKFKVTAVQLPANTPAITTTPLSVDSLAKAISEIKPPQMTVPLTQMQTAEIRESQDSSDSSTLSRISQLSGAQPSQQKTQIPFLISDSNAALSAELSRRTTVDITGAGSHETAGLSLDNKIRQCMDLVGNHLIIAVREELGQVTSELSKLKEKVEQLEFENSALRSENIILRSATGSDLLTRSQFSRKK